MTEALQAMGLATNSPVVIPWSQTKLVQLCFKTSVFTNHWQIQSPGCLPAHVFTNRWQIQSAD